MGVGSDVAAEGSDTTRRILVAAAEEFARRGYAGTRVRDIVQSARVNLAAINYYFGGKAGLYAATLRHLTSTRRPDGPERRGQTPQSRLHREVFAMLERFIGGKRASPLSRILAHEAMNPTSHHDRLVEDMLRPRLECFRVLVRELAGPRMSEAEVAGAAVGIVGQCLVYLSARGPIDQVHPELTHGRDACKRLAREITDFALAGIEGLTKTPRHVSDVSEGVASVSPKRPSE